MYLHNYKSKRSTVKNVSTPLASGAGDCKTSTELVAQKSQYLYCPVIKTILIPWENDVMDSCIPSSVGDARSTQNVNKEIYSSGSLVYGAKLALKPKVIKLITLTQLSEVSGLPRGRHQLLNGWVEPKIIN